MNHKGKGYNNLKIFTKQYLPVLAFVEDHTYSSTALNGKKIDIIAEKSVIFGPNFQL